GDSVTLSLDGDDAAIFTYSGGVLLFSFPTRRSSDLDLNGDNVYDVTVKANDGVHTTTLAVAATVTNTNDNAPVITGAATHNVAEKTAAAWAYSSRDTDVGSLTLSLTGDDAALFTITG